MVHLADFIHDITENAIRAKAEKIEITLELDNAKDIISMTILDNGQGIESDKLNQVVSPFYSSKTTRKIGLGLPFLKAAAQLCNGQFSIQSTIGEGTKVQASFQASHLDCPMFGDLANAIFCLMIHQDAKEIIYHQIINQSPITIDKDEIVQAIAPLTLNDSTIVLGVREYLQERIMTHLGGRL